MAGCFPYTSLVTTGCLPAWFPWDTTLVGSTTDASVRNKEVVVQTCSPCCCKREHFPQQWKRKLKYSNDPPLA